MHDSKESKIAKITELKYMREANIFDSNAQALVNPVNCLGVSGAGLALSFKNMFPENDRLYKQACKDGLCSIGNCYITVGHPYPNFIINFPTKKHFKDPSTIDYIKQGMDSLLELTRLYKITSIAIPLLGCGLGGLKKDEVIPLIVNPLWNERGIVIELYI
jgi:O-acetyl-ADP-ribose deacetylase (regulator of RNase III)